MIRTTDTSTYRTLQYNLTKTSNTLNQLYIKSSTGKEVAKASDAPGLVRTIVSSRSAITSGERYIENCQHVQDNMATSETAIDSIKDLLDRAKEIAVAGANDSVSDSDLDTYADEVSMLSDSLLDLANTKVDGKYIFGGYNDETEPFSGSPVTYNGTDDHQMIEISPGIKVAKNVTGEELFMDPVNIFTTLDDLETALRNGDSDDISDQLTTIEEAADQVRSQQSTLGNNSARIDDIITVHQNSILQLQESLSNHEDADLSEVLSEVAKMELCLEATMQVTARVSSLSLLNYL